MENAKDRLAVRGGRIASLAETAIKLKRFHSYSQVELDNWQIKEFFDAIEWLDDVTLDELINLQILAKAAWDGQ